MVENFAQGFELRDYQKKAIELAYESMRNNPDSHPCIVMPTASGKSYVIAGVCDDFLKNRDDGRVLLLSHRKELLVQDGEKISNILPDAPMGFYCAGLGKYETDRLTIASVQTLARNIKNFSEDESRFDLAIIDEAHLIGPHTKQYNEIKKVLREINPNVRFLGLTATPYRMDQGKLTEGKDALFTELIEPITIDELIDRGVLCPLVSSFSDTVNIDLSQFRLKMGDFLTQDMEAVYDTGQVNYAIANEACRRGEGRRSWLFFCVTKLHALNMRDVLQKFGINAEVLLSDSSNRDEIIRDFKEGKIRALTTVGVLTTGFDYPELDMLVMARPTMSPGLYVQMAGRGMRAAPGKDDCLVLDFGQNIARHGPITEISSSGYSVINRICPICGTKVVKTAEECPKCGRKFTKICPKCHSIISNGVLKCDKCGYDFPKECPVCGKESKRTASVCKNCGYKWEKAERKVTLPDAERSNENIMEPPITARVRRWSCEVLKTGNDDEFVLAVRYFLYGNFIGEVTELLSIGNAEGYAQSTAREFLNEICLRNLKCVLDDAIFGSFESMSDLAWLIENRWTPPIAVTIRKFGDRYRILKRKWEETAVA